MQQSVEEMIQAAGATAPRITPQRVQDVIVAEYSGRASDLFKDAPVHPSLECLTLHVVVLRNGFTVVGKSACASPANYRADIGARIARDDAVRQIDVLEGYLLKQNLFISRSFDEACEA